MALDDCGGFTVLLTSLPSREKAGDPGALFPLMCWLFFSHLIKNGEIIQPAVSSLSLPGPHLSLIKLVIFGNCSLPAVSGVGEETGGIVTVKERLGNVQQCCEWFHVIGNCVIGAM